MTVFNMMLSGKTGCSREKAGAADVWHCAATSHAARGVLKPFFYLLWFFRGLSIGMKFRETDIIHAHGSTLAGTLALAIGRRLRVPVVITEHTNPFAKLMKRFSIKILTRRALEKADAVLVVSDDLRRQILASPIAPKKVFVTFNPVDTTLFCTDSEKNQDTTKSIIFVGRLEPYKGALRTVLAFEKIAEKYPGWNLIIIGDGPEEQSIQQYIKNNSGLARRITLKGKLSREAISRELKQASIFAMPSEHESFGISLAEAMASGLPVIAGSGTAPDEFVDHDSGILVSPGDIDAIAGAMTSMIDNPAWFNAGRIREKAVREFGLEAFGMRLVRIYRELI